MRAHWLHEEYDFTLPPDRVFPYLSEHENLGDVFGAQIDRLNDGDETRNGVGSRRRLKVAPGAAPFVETVTVSIPNERIEYKITEGGPMQDHIGIMVFTPRAGGGTHLDYRIRLSSKIPGLSAIVRVALKKNIAKGMAGVDAKA
jgi:uncharacterized protein YndB with AHSA1/START domain